MRSSAVVLGLVLLAACDSGGPSPTPTPTPSPVNNPPTMTSPATVSVAENTTSVFYTATATDPEGGALTYSITGGADADKFQISASGGLSFKTAPDFEVPTDRDRANRYQVEITARDPLGSGGRITVTVTVTDTTSGAFRVRRVATGFDHPVYASHMERSGTLLVVEKTGKIKVFSTNDNRIGSTYLDVSSEVSTDGDRGLLGLAIPPNYGTDFKAYIFMTNLAGDIEVRRYYIVRPTPTGGGYNFYKIDETTADVILKIPHSGSNRNYGGWIGFGDWAPSTTPLNLLITVGDAADCDGPLDWMTIRNCNARNRTNFLGKVLRINPDSDQFPDDPDRDYRIPTPNPYGSEIIMFGLRNPYRASFDRASLTGVGTGVGDFWFADQGASMEEEVNRLNIPLGYPSNNKEAVMDFDWPYREGSKEKVFDTGVILGSSQNPKVVYTHGTGPLQGSAVVGGYMYRGPVESLQGVYVFGDRVTGRVFSYRPGFPIQDRTVDFIPDAGAINNITSFAEDYAGNLYILDQDGDLFRVEPAPD